MDLRVGNNHTLMKPSHIHRDHGTVPRRQHPDRMRCRPATVKSLDVLGQQLVLEGEIEVPGGVQTLALHPSVEGPYRRHVARQAGATMEGRR